MIRSPAAGTDGVSTNYRKKVRFGRKSKEITVLCRFLSIWLMVLPNLSATSLSGTEDIPVERFFANSGFSRFRISPDGAFLSALAPWKGAPNLYVVELATRTPTRVTSITQQTINNYFWASDERLVYTMDHDGNESWGLFAVNRDGTAPVTLVEPLLTTGSLVFRYTRPLDILPGDPGAILVINNARRLEYPDVYRLDLFSGGRAMVARNPGNFTAWRTDQDGRVRFGEARDDNGGIAYYWRIDETSPWRKLASFAFSEPKWRPIGPPDFDLPAVLRPLQQPFTHDGERLYVSSDIDRACAAIFELDPATGAIGRLIFEAPGYDVSNLVISDELRQPIGVYYQTDLPRVHWFHKEKRQIQQFLEAKFPGLFTILVNADRTHTRMVTASYSDRQPVIYSLLEIRDGAPNIEILAGNEAIDPSLLAKTSPIQYQARDGLTLHGYLTLPNGRDPHGLPLLVHPHGGPQVRDSWTYDPQVQFFANRGFSVLQVNFRSSYGYGRAFLHAGDKQWGTTMQTDLVDGIEWLHAQGIIDRSRIGIYGSSYGGYAVMAQLVWYPQYYRFGINFVGPSELSSLINWRKKWGQDAVYGIYKKTIGDPKTQSDLLARFSPIHYVDRIEAPVFIVHGTRDPRVPIDQATNLRKALRKHGKDFEWLVKKDEGHGFRKTSNRIELFSRIDAFIAPYR